MKDPRYANLAQSIINYSLKIKAGEKLYIQTYGSDFNITKALLKECYKVGAIPFLKNNNDELLRLLIENCTEEQMRIIFESELEFSKQMDAYVAIYAYDNSNEYAGTNQVNVDVYNKWC